MDVVYRTERFTIVKKAKKVRGETVWREYISLPAAVAVLAVKEGRVVFVRQFRGALGLWTLEIPAGAVEEGETPEEAAARELAEEAGYDPLRLVHLSDFFPSPGVSDEVIKIYYADGLRASSMRDGDPGEGEIDVVEVAVEDALWLVEAGVINDGKTALALMYAARRGLLPSC